MARRNEIISGLAKLAGILAGGIVATCLAVCGAKSEYKSKAALSGFAATATLVAYQTSKYENQNYQGR